MAVPDFRNAGFRHTGIAVSANRNMQLENITKWEKPELTGIAMKPPEENMSEYCRARAVTYFADLINNLDVKYIAVTYSNTDDSKSYSSKNKITLEQIKSILESKGETKIYKKETMKKSL